MTDRFDEKAREICDCADIGCDPGPLIAQALRDAVAQEREACAKVADTYPDREPCTDDEIMEAESIATAIRSRGQDD